MQLGRIDLMFHDQENAQVSLQFDNRQLKSEGMSGGVGSTSSPESSVWFDNLQAEKIALYLTVGLKALHSKRWHSAPPDGMNEDQLQAVAEAPQVDHWMLETHRVMSGMLQVPVDEAHMRGLGGLGVGVGVGGGRAVRVSSDDSMRPANAAVSLLVSARSDRQPQSQNCCQNSNTHADFEEAVHLVMERPGVWPYSRATLLVIFNACGFR